MTDMEKQLKALANRRRISIVKFLKKSQTAAVGEIAKEIKLSFKSTSRHLSVLLAAGLINREQVGLTAQYGLSQPEGSLVKLVMKS